MPFGLGAPELILVLVIVVLLFGAGRIANIGGSLGRSIREFRAELKDDPAKTQREDKEV